IEHGDTMNVVAFRTKRDGVWDDAEWVKPMDRAAMEHDFDGWVDPVRQILKLMQKPDIWALFHHRPGALSYCKNRVCLLGDAAHASTPHNGAGAGMAIEDALCMSRLLARVYDSKDLPRAFVAFDRVRRPRTQRHVEDSYITGQLYDFHEAGVDADIPKVQERLATKMDWYWHYDLDAEATEAQRVYEEEAN
ncbi:MAG: FAD-dependent monooxygenase, partial [Terriglobus roseus]|nr:FAD-dependent monooxygenase [Terriglobus roseus]